MFDSSGAFYYLARTHFEGNATINWSVNYYGYLNGADIVDHVDLGVKPAIKISF